jgi:hypothetical protein
MNDLTRGLCVVCSDAVDPETAHWLHTFLCGKPHRSAGPDVFCDCDVVAHPECCPEPECQEAAP